MHLIRGMATRVLDQNDVPFITVHIYSREKKFGVLLFMSYLSSVLVDQNASGTCVCVVA